MKKKATLLETIENSNIELKITDPELDPRWDEFVTQHPAGKVYHCSAWLRVIARTYGYKLCCVLAEQEKDENVIGIMPLFYINNRITRKRLIGLPFTTYCDPLMSPSILHESIVFVRDQFPSASFIQLRLMGYSLCELVHDMPPEEFVTHILDLRPGSDTIFRAFHTTSIRQRIRRAERIGLTFRLGNREEDLKDFFKLLVCVRKRHGLPPHPYKFFSNMWHFLGPTGLMKLGIVEHKGRPVSAAVLLLFGDSVHLEYSASDEKSMNLCTNQKLIWECIKIAYNSNAQYFDFGRTAISNRSLIDFKERWGAKKRILSYVNIPPQMKRRSEDGFLQRYVTALNKRMPYWLLRMEGEVLYRKLGRG